jgi:hypothetical protein
MMKSHRPGRLRMLAGAAAIVTLGGLSLAFGSASAQPAPPAPPAASAPQSHDGARREERVIVRTYRGDEHRDHARSERREGGNGERREERHVMVITNDGDGHGDSADHHRRMMEMHGPDGHALMMMGGHDCQGANRSEVNEGSDSNRTRVIVCTRGRDGAGNPAQQAEALQRARARLAEDNQIPAEQRQRVLAALDREIARLRGAQ